MMMNVKQQEERMNNYDDTIRVMASERERERGDTKAAPDRVSLCVLWRYL